MARKSGPPYQLAQLARVNASVQRLAEKARRLGSQAELRAALLDIVAKLQTTPDEHGDPERQTRKVGGTVYHMISHPLYVQYAVYEPEKIVCLLRLEALSNDPLGREE